MCWLLMLLIIPFVYCVDVFSVNLLESYDVKLLIGR